MVGNSEFNDGSYCVKRCTFDSGNYGGKSGLGKALLPAGLAVKGIDKPIARVQQLLNLI